MGQDSEASVVNVSRKVSAPLPPAVNNVIGREVRGVTLNPVRTRYSEADVVAAGGRVARLTARNDDLLGATLPRRDHSGLVIEMAERRSSVAALRQAARMPITVRMVSQDAIPVLLDSWGR